MRSIGFVLVAAVVFCGCVALVYAFTDRGAPVEQPIAFNHAVHIGDAGLACTYCHARAETGVSAGLPRKSVCLDCHDVDDEQGDHPEKDKLFAYDEVDDDIPWRRVTVDKPDVFFSHRRHVVAGKLECLECHPDQPTLTRPPSRVQLVKSMDECIACHQEHQVSTDCLACHR